MGEMRARFLCGTLERPRHGISRVPVYYARKLISAQRKVKRRPFKARAHPDPLKTPVAILSLRGDFITFIGGIQYSFK